MASQVMYGLKAADGNQTISAKYRCSVAWFIFSSFCTVATGKSESSLMVITPCPASNVSLPDTLNTTFICVSICQLKAGGYDVNNCVAVPLFQLVCSGFILS